MYGLQTAPSPRLTNCKIQRNIGNQHHDCSSIKDTNFFFGVILDENCGIHTTRTSRNRNFAIRLVIFSLFFLSYNSNPSPLPSPLLCAKGTGVVSGKQIASVIEHGCRQLNE